MRRRQFINNVRFTFYLYKYEPDDHIGIVGENEVEQSSNQHKDEEKHKRKEVEKRVKDFMKGFMVKNSFFKKMSPDTTPAANINKQKSMRQKHKYKVESIQEFIITMQNKFGKIMQTVLGEEDLEYAGLSKCFQDFFNKIRPLVESDEVLNQDLEYHMTEINEYIMIRLYRYCFLLNNKITKSERDLNEKLDLLSNAKPEAFGIPTSTFQKNQVIWDLAIKELRKIQVYITPKTKVQQILSSFSMINSAFSLFGSESQEQATADDILQIFPYIILKAKIKRLGAHIKYIKIFDLNIPKFDAMACAFNNLEISLELLMRFNQKVQIEEDFELQIQVDPSLKKENNDNES